MIGEEEFSTEMKNLNDNDRTIRLLRGGTAEVVKNSDDTENAVVRKSWA